MSFNGPIRPVFHGNAGTLFGLYFKHFLLNLVTLGLYSFWAKANVRTYLYGQVSLANDRFAYHGTGKELLKGWFKALGLVLVLVIVAGVASYFIHDLVGRLLFLAVFGFVIFPIALIGSRRYRLSRSSWRGIRFSFRGDVRDFYGLYLHGALLMLITLGFYAPYFHARIRKYLVDKSHYGHISFAFSGNGRDLFGAYLLSTFLGPLTLGLSNIWYAARRARYYWANTRMEGTTFESTVSFRGLLGLYFVNGLVVLLTLGLAFSWAMARTVEYQCANLIVTPDAALDEIRQDARTANATAESLGDLMDVEMVGADFFGI